MSEMPESNAALDAHLIDPIAVTLPPPAPLAPVARGERLSAVDLLRGIAVLGILAMNIYAFAMPFAAYTNPPLYGTQSPLDDGAWVVTHIFFELKFLAIFSMLFGAGLVYMAERACARGLPFRGLIYRRLGWLLVIGLLHGYLLWLGDILFTYAVCGMLLFPFWRRSPRALLTWGIVFLLVSVPMGLGLGAAMQQLRNAAQEAQAVVAAGGDPSAEQQAILKQWEGMQTMMAPSPEMIAKDVEIYRGGYGGIVVYRAPFVFSMQVTALPIFLLWRVGGLILVGMGLAKLGVFAAARSRRFYTWCVGLGYGLGLPLSVLSVQQLTAHNFDPFYVMGGGGSFYNYFGSLGVALGHVGVAMLIYQSGVLPRLRERLIAVGRMAFSNYLMHSLVFTTLFYGYGFGLYGDVNRFALMGFVVAMWILQLYLSPWWLRRFRFGPAEWLWRSLTYGRRQPMRRDAAGTLEAAEGIPGG